MQTSYSQQRTVLRCPKKFEYHYVRKIRPKRDDDKFLLGRAVHEFLDIYYGTQIEGPRDAAFLSALRTFEDYTKENFPNDDSALEQAELAEGIVKHYHEWASQNDNFNVLGTEIPFEVKIADSTWTGRFDGVIEVGGKLWIMEHKTAKQVKTEHVLRDKQISAYVLAAKKLGIEVEGVVYNTLKKALPQKPAVLKSGKLSKAKNANITYDTYMQAINELDHDPDSYGDILDGLKGLENPFFQREFVPRTEENSKAVLQDVRATELLKYTMIQNNLFPRNDTKDCSWDCPFNELCLAEAEGNETTVLFRDQYAIKATT